MTKLAVLSTPSQYSRIIQESIHLDEYEIWCDDERHYTFFESKGLKFKKLDEDLIAGEWEKINSWSCETAARWAQFCRRQNFFKEIDWPMVTCILTGYLLAPMLRSYHFAKFLLNQGSYQKILIFSEHGQKDFPHFSGNAFLNYFLEFQAHQRSISIQKINLKVESQKNNWQPETRSFFRAQVLSKLKKAVQIFYGFIVKPKRQYDVLAFGSLRHLGSAIAELRKTRLNIALYDFEFHLEQFLFAIKQQIPYLLPESFPNHSNFDEQKYAAEIARQFEAAFELSKNSDLFVYDQVNFREFIQICLFGSMKVYFSEAAKKINHYQNIANAAQIKSVLIDDDITTKGGLFAGFFKSVQSRVFCVSHANLAVHAKVSAEHCGFYQSETFVNSEFEKSNYVRRGWNPDHLRVTGTPRYDRLITLNRQALGNQKEGISKILFCGTGLWSFSPDVYSYIGNQKECFGDVQLPALEATFKAIKDLPVELMIKPHSFEMTPLWKKLIAQSGVADKIVLKKHSDDIFKLLGECDAMILAYWSTTIIESAIINKPTIFIDFRAVKRQLLYEYASQGFCYPVSHGQSLREVIEKICRRDFSMFKTDISENKRQYYLGVSDGKASERVAEKIKEELKAV